MNTLNYSLKYCEYLVIKCRSFFTTDLYFHTAELNKIAEGYYDIKIPMTLSEKICHRLVFNHNVLYTLLADKLAVREYVQTRTQLVKVIPLIGVYNRADDIDFNKLSARFVLKCNYDCGSAIICSDKEKFNSVHALNKLNLALKKNM